MIVWERNITVYWVESTYFLFSLINVLERERKKVEQLRGKHKYAFILNYCNRCKSPVLVRKEN